MFKSSFYLTAIVLSAGMVGHAYAAADAPSAAVEARYQSDRMVCMSGQSNQSEATCLKEAGAARDAARRHQLVDVQPSYQANALRRCAALPPEDKRDCESRMRGEGSISGSVRDGGVIRETTTIVPADPSR